MDIYFHLFEFAAQDQGLCKNGNNNNNNNNTFCTALYCPRADLHAIAARSPHISNQYAAPFRVSMAIPHDVAAVGDSGTEGDSRAPLLRDEAVIRVHARRCGIFYCLFSCGRASLIHKLLPTSCGQQQPDGHGGEGEGDGGGGPYIKSAAVRWTTLALLLGFSAPDAHRSKL